MRTLLFILIAALLCVLSSGCTAIGLGIGIAADSKYGQSQQATSSEVKTIPRGRDVQVTLTSGDTLRGKSAGMRALPADSYRCAYDSARTQWAADSLLPPLGEVVFVVPWQGRCFSGVFHGFEGKALLIRRTGDDTLTSLLPPDSSG
jgi:hypothetical protein